MFDREIYSKFLNREISRAKALDLMMGTDARLSQGQRGIYSSYIMNPDSTGYNIPGAFYLRQDVRMDVLEKSIYELLHRYKILSSYFTNDGGQVRRIVKEPGAFQLITVNLAQDEDLEARLLKESREIFSLAEGPLFCVKVFMTPDHRHVLYLNFHHIIFDGISAQIFLGALKETYQSLIDTLSPLKQTDGAKAERKKLSTVEYTLFVQDEYQYLDSEEAVNDKKYWYKQLTGAKRRLKLLGQTLESGEYTNTGASRSRMLERQLTQSILEPDAGQPVTAAAKMLAAYMILLWHLTGENDVNVGVPVSNRGLKYENAIGYYINMIVIRHHLKKTETFAILAQRVHELLQEGISHGRYPYYHLIKEMNSQEQNISAQLFPAAFYFNRGPVGEDDVLYDGEVESVHQTGEYDLAFEITSGSAGMRLRIKYHPLLFHEEDINEMVETYNKILAFAVHHRNKEIGTLLATGENDKNNKNDKKSSSHHSFIAMFYERVLETPNAVALVFENMAMTYEEVYQNSVRLAVCLKEHGVIKGSFVGILLERSLNLPLALIAVQMAGGVYIPLDPKFPEDRLQYMFDQAKLQFLITDGTKDGMDQKSVKKLLLFNRLWEECQAVNISEAAVPFEIEPDQLAYILFTSGSTGNPKGIMISHGALGNFLIAMAEEPGCRSTDYLLAVTTISFDIAGLELFLMLTVGGTVEILREEISRDGISLLEKLESSRTTIMQATPATWHMLLAAGWEKKKDMKILCGGEALTRELADRLLELGDEVWNLYGPTETTIWSMVSKVEFHTSVNLGRPIRNTSIYVLNEAMQEVGVNEIGELYIGGDGLAKGYLNNRAETEKRFIYYAPEQGLIYKTGDLVKKADDHEIYYMGREDHQVKVNGFRIELGEIEETLQKIAGIHRAVVVLRGEENSKKMTAFLNGVPGESQPDSEAVRSALKKELPDYMIPHQFIYLPAYPLTLNLKVDRKQLMTMEIEDLCRTGTPVQKSAVMSYVRKAAAGIKKLEESALKPDQNLGAYGFDSISFTALSAAINKHYGIKSRPTVFYTYSTLEGICDYLTDQFGDAIGRTTAVAAQELLSEQDREDRQIKPNKPMNEDKDIAIVGIGAKLPGADSPAEFWDNLIREVNLITEIPIQRYDWTAYYDKEDSDPNKIRSKWGGFINGVDQFDAEFFQISPREAELMDPQQRIVLQVVWETIENAGYNPRVLSGQEIGVFIGATSTDYMEIILRETGVKAHTLTGIANSIIANRVSYLYNFTGPSEVIDTACSSGLVSVCRAVEAIRSGSCEAAIAGGVNLLLSPFPQVALSKASMLSPDGRCKAFDESADGYVRGEGAVVFLLKPLSQARADRDHIYAVIKGMAVNHCGKTNSLTAPNAKAQATVIAKAFKDSGFAPESVSYIETHGTGTALGDPIEIDGLRMAFAERCQELGTDISEISCGLGSVKTNIGHLEAASGCASLLKLVLAMEHRYLPATLHQQRLNPYIDFPDDSFYIQKTAAAWPGKETSGSKGVLRGGVSAFGFGGTNAHILLEKGQAEEADQPEASPIGVKGVQLFLLSAQYEQGIKEIAGRLLKYVNQFADQPEMIRSRQLAGMAYTLQTGREFMKYRIAILAATVEELQAALQCSIEEKQNAAVFRVQGNQAVSFMEEEELAALAVKYLEEKNLTKVAKLWCNGFDIDWKQLYREPLHKLPLPAYPFQKISHWIPTVHKNAVYHDSRRQPLIDELSPEHSIRDGLVFKKEITCQNPLASDHVVKSRLVMPGTSFLEMGLEGVSQLTPLQSVRMSNIIWHQQLVIEENQTKPILISIKQAQGGYAYEITSQSEPGLVYATGTIGCLNESAEVGTLDLETVKNRSRDSVGRQQFYQSVSEEAGISYGAYFQHLDRLYRTDQEALGLIRLSRQIISEQPHYYAHPAVMDCALQAMAGLMSTGGRSGKTLIPFSAEEIRIHQTMNEGEYYVHVIRVREGVHNITLTDRTGKILVQIKHLVSRQIQRKESDLYIPEWEALTPETLKKKEAGRLPERALIFYHEASRAIQQKLNPLLYRESTEAYRIVTSAGPEPQSDQWIRYDDERAYRLLMEEYHPDTIYFLGSLVEDYNFYEDVPEFVSKQKSGLWAFFHLIRGLQDVSAPVEICVLTNHVASVDGRQRIFPVNAGLYSFSKTAMLENRKLLIRIYDLTGLESCGSEDLAEIIHRKKNPEQIKITDYGWYRRKYVRLRPEFSKTASAFRKNGVYLIVGMGGIGKELGIYLAQRYQATILYISKGKLDENRSAHLQKIERSGGQGCYYQADITDKVQMRRTAAQIQLSDYPKINGIIVGAMVLQDAKITAMSGAEFELVMAPKVQGTLELLQAFHYECPDFVLFLSSMNAWTGNAGQGNYCAACGCQDALAASLREQVDYPVRVINWSYWGSVGAVSGAKYNHLLMDKGLYPIEAEEGMEIIERVLSSSYNQVIMCKANPGVQEELGLGGGEEIEAYPELSPFIAAAPGYFEPPAEKILWLDEGFRKLEAFGAGLILDFFQEAGLFLHGKEEYTFPDLQEKLALINAYVPLLKSLLAILEKYHYVEVYHGKYRGTDRRPDKALDGFEEAAYPETEPYSRLMRICVHQFSAVLSGKTDYTAVLFPGGSKELVEKIYKGNPVADYFNQRTAAVIREYIKNYLEVCPAGGIKILEIGAGTGGTSLGIFKSVQEYGSSISYLYSDISPSFTRYGEETYGREYPFVSFKVLDIEKDPVSQQFEEAEFDLITATNVLHATEDISRTLKHIKRLLKKNGMLVINEITQFKVFSTLTFGLTDGWWKFKDSCRISESPLLTAEAWEHKMAAAGFYHINVFPGIDSWADATQHVMTAYSDGIVRRDAPYSDGIVRKEAPGMEAAEAPVPDLPFAVREDAGTREEQSRMLPTALHEQVIAWLQKEFSGLLKAEVSHRDIERNLEQMGMDSLLIIELLKKWGATFPQLPATLLFEYNTLTKLSQYLTESYPQELAVLLGDSIREKKAILPEQKHLLPQTVPESQEAAKSFGNRSGRRKEIAIIGMSGKYPGAENLSEYWFNLKTGRDCTGVIPPERWNYRDYYDEDIMAKGKGYSKWGGFLKDIRGFDANFFAINMDKACEMDPQERLLLESAWSTLEDAGYPDQTVAGLHKKAGVFIGTMYTGYGQIATKAWENGIATNAQSAHWMLPNRISHYFNFNGPSIAVDTACSSSMTAIHLAVRSIQNEECDLALAGGVNLILHPRQHVRLANLNSLSKTGKNLSFNEHADGFVEGEGVGTVLLKPLEDAIADGDLIYGVIKGSGVNSNGGDGNFTTPSIEAQTKLLQDTFRQAEIAPESVTYVEAHVTGTILGDSIEVGALNKVFATQNERRYKCAIGTVKANIGHIEAASGIAALTKVLLQMKYKKLVPSIHSEPVSPFIRVEGNPFYIPRYYADWNPEELSGEGGNHENIVRRACINSYGAGGSNASLIIEEYQKAAEQKTVDVSQTSSAENIIVLSARSRKSLSAYLLSLKEYLERETAEGVNFSMHDIAYTLQTGRKEMESRLAFVASGIPELQEKLELALHHDESAVYFGNASELQGTADPDQYSMAELARRWTLGQVVEWRKLYTNERSGAKISLPTYCFQHQSCWIQEAESAAGEYQVSYSGDDAYVQGHNSFGKRTLLGMTYCSIMNEMLHKTERKGECFRLNQFMFLEPIALEREEKVEIVPEIQGHELRCMAEKAERRICAAEAKLVENPDFRPYTIEIPDFSTMTRLSAKRLYDKKPNVYSEALHCIDSVYLHQNRVWGKLSLSREMRNREPGYRMDPLLLDGAVLCRLAFMDEEEFDKYIPFMIKNIYFCRRIISGQCYCVVSQAAVNNEFWEGSIEIFDELGNLAVYMEGIVCKKVFVEGEERAVLINQKSLTAERKFPNDSLKEQMEQYLRVQIAELTGRQIGTRELGMNLMTIGCDSVQMIKLSQMLQAELRIELFPTVFFEHPSIHALAEYFSNMFEIEVKDMLENKVERKTLSTIESKSVDPPALSAFDIPGGNENDEIAIVGISGMFPQSSDLEEFWHQIVNRDDLITTIPQERWDWKAYCKDGVNDAERTNVIWGGFMKDIDKFDPEFFGISAREAKLMDPQQRVSLMLAWHAIEDAGYAPGDLAGSRTGVFIGVADHDYNDIDAQVPGAGQSQRLTGNAHNILTGRISYLLDLHGPSEPVDTACASSSIALIHAVDAIQNNRCDMALAGGVHIMLNPRMYVAFDSLGILSGDGKCRAFDQDANGTVRGEGAGLVFLKRLGAAIADGDHIYAVVKGTGISHGGRSSSMTAPNPVQQEAAITDAFLRGRIDPATVGYIEAHGTGTVLGDPIEIIALKNAFQKLTGNQNLGKTKSCGVGSIKTQIGHLETAAGIAGLLKMILAMKHGILPGINHFQQLNPYINLDDSPFYIHNTTGRWERIRDESGRELPYRAGVSTFGFSGINAHIILEEYRDTMGTQLEKNRQESREMILLSAKNKTRLKAYVNRLQGYLERGMGGAVRIGAEDRREPMASVTLPEFSDFAYTLRIGRSPLEERLAVTAKNYRELLHALTAYTAEDFGWTGLYCAENLELTNLKQTQDAGEIPYREDILAWLEQGEIPRFPTDGTRKRVSLPGYPFEQKSFWAGNRIGGFTTNKTVHQHILIDRIVTEDPHPIYEKTFDSESFYLRDHIINDACILPGVMTIEMACAAAAEADRGKSAVSLQDIVWLRPFTMKERYQTARIHLEAAAAAAMNFSLVDSRGIIHAKGRVHLADQRKRSQEVKDYQKLIKTCPCRLSQDEFYELFLRCGFRYGSTFCPVEQLWYGENLAVGILQAAQDQKTVLDGLILNPLILEGSLQTAGYLINKEHTPENPYVPFEIGEIRIYDALPSRCYVSAAVIPDQSGDQQKEVTITISDMNGRTLVEIKKYTARPLAADTVSKLTPVGRSMTGSLSELIPAGRSMTGSLSELTQAMRSVADSTSKSTRDERIMTDTTSKLAQIIAEMIDLDAAVLEPERELIYYNVDSMLLAELAAKINSSFNCNLTPASFFEIQPLTLVNIAAYINDKYDSRIWHEQIKPPAPEADHQNAGGVAAEEQVSAEDQDSVAVIGMAGRFPNSEDVEEFWENLIQNKDMISEIPAERFSWQDYFGDAIKEENKTNSKWGGFMKEVDKFDAEFFHITPKEAKLMDPQQRIFLETVWETFEDAGYPVSEYYGSKTGVYLGVSNLDYADYVNRQKTDALTMTGNNHPLIVNKISHFFNFTGPSEPVDTLCSSSLVAFHRAVADIRSGMCETAIVGGINVILSPRLYISYGNANMLSPEGRCKTFDASADGFVRGEGVGAFLLKPLSKAVKDDDHIYAVIKGSAINHCGHTKSLTAPSPIAQAEVIQMALDQGGVDFHTVNYLELHGTGTPLGDPIEINGIKNVYDNALKAGRGMPPERCYLGAVKTNVGHLESGAGMVSVVKALLALKHKKIPANLHFTRQNPYIDLKNTPFTFVNENTEWESLKDSVGNTLPRRVGVSSFGAGGVNAHIIFEEYEPVRGVRSANTGFYPFVLSADNEEQLHRYVEQVIPYVRETSHSLQDITYTSIIAREALNERLAIIADTTAELLRELENYREGIFSERIFQTDHHDGRMKQDDDQTDGRMKQDGEQTDGWQEKCRQWVNHDSVNMKELSAVPGRRGVAFPKYPFRKERHWVEDRPSMTEGLISAAGRTSFFQYCDGSDGETIKYEFVLSGNESYIKDHVIEGRRILPGVLYLEMTRFTMESVSGRKPIGVEQVVWAEPLSFEDTNITLTVRITDGSSAHPAFEVTSKEEGRERLHCKGRLLFETGSIAADKMAPGDFEALRSGSAKKIGGNECYEMFRALGFDYGQAFRVIQQAYIHSDGILVHLAQDQTGLLFEECVIKPIIDGMLQGTMLEQQSAGPGSRYLPHRLQSFVWHNNPGNSGYAYIQPVTTPGMNEQNKYYNIFYLDKNGNTTARMTGFVKRKVGNEKNQQLVCQERWIGKEITVKTPDRIKEILVVSDNQEYVQQLAKIFSNTVQLTVVKSNTDYKEEFLKQKHRNHAVDTILYAAPFDRNYSPQDNSFDMMRLLKAYAAVYKEEKMRLIYVYGWSEHFDYVYHRSISGFLKSAGLEFAGLRIKLLETRQADQAAQSAAEVLAEQTEPFEDIRYGPKRYIRKLIEIEETEQVKEIKDAGHLGRTNFKKNGVYLIAGGMGGIGRHLTRHLVRNYQAEVMVIGRKRMDPEMEEFAAEMKSYAGSFDYFITDIADAAQILSLQNEIRNRYGRLDGILQLAGYLQDGYIMRKTEEMMKKVYAPKLQGTMNLDRIAETFHPELFILFSSITATTGNAGQSDYAYANSFMSAYADYRNRKKKDKTTFSVSWPLWENGGMGISGAVRERMKQVTGFDAMPNEMGIRNLEHTLKSNYVVFYGNRKKIRELFHIEPESEYDEHWHQDRDAAEENKMRLENLLYATVDFIKAAVSKVTEIPVGNISDKISFERYGIDSLVMLKLGAELEPILQKASDTIFLEYQNIYDLSQYLLNEYREPLISFLQSQGRLKSDPVMYAAEKNINADFMPAEQGHEEPYLESSKNDIAVIGISGKYPSSDNLEEYWQNLRNGVNCITKIPAERWDGDGFFSESKEDPNRSYSKWGGFISGVAEFDPLFFHIPPAEAELMDPQERLFIQEVWKTIDNAGYTVDQLKRSVGVFVGVMYKHYPWAARNTGLESLQSCTSYWEIANRVSYLFDFRGPSYAIDTACSSSLTAIHLACGSLRANECETAIAGGINLSLIREKYLGLSSTGMIGSHDKSMSLAGGDGYIPGEGVGAVLLKPLEKAVRDHDIIYGVIKGTATNHGGKNNSFAVPGPVAQAEVMTDAIKRAGISRADINYIEIAANGSELGDKVELNALKKVFSQMSEPITELPVGTVKGNIGHLEAASGISQLTKVLLQMKYKELLPTLNADPDAIGVDLKGTGLTILREVRPWDGRNRCALINSFGAGGANASLVIEEYHDNIIGREDVWPLFFAFSAVNKKALVKIFGQMYQFIEKYEGVFADVSYTLLTGRKAMPERTGIVANSKEDLLNKLTCCIRSEKQQGIYTGYVEEGMEETSAEGSQSLFTPGQMAVLWVNGIQLMPAEMTQLRSAVKVSLPPYPFAKELYWYSNANGNSEAGEAVKIFPEPVKTEFQSTKEFIKSIIFELTKIPMESLKEDQAFVNYFDSLTVKRLINRIEDYYRIQLSVKDVFTHSTIEKLSEYLGPMISEKQQKAPLDEWEEQIMIELLQNVKEGIITPEEALKLQNNLLH